MAFGKREGVRTHPSRHGSAGDKARGDDSLYPCAVIRDSSAKEREFHAYYLTLARTWGNPHWWPARSRFEVIVGAYLTQNTAWSNVELSLRRLRREGMLSLDRIREAPPSHLESLIRSAGYFRQKARRLKKFVAFLDERYAGSLSRMFALPTEKLRDELLGLEGIGPETADSILLYAGQHPAFVVDAYTRRILERHGITAGDSRYVEIREFCERSLAKAHTPSGSKLPSEFGAPGACHRPSRMSSAQRSPTAQIYNEMHGLIVGVGKNFCLKSRPKCEQCPLQPFLPKAKRRPL
jgi:endonuclease III related protein